MAISASNLCSTATATDAVSYNLPSADYPANALIIVSINNSRAASVGTATITGLTGATWTNPQNVVFNTTGTPLNRLQTYYTMIQTSQNGVTLTASFGGSTQTGFAGVVDVITGCATSGSDGTGAVVQSNSKSTIATSISIAIGSGLETTNNQTYSVFGRPANTAILTAAANFTQLVDIGAATPAKRIMSQFGLTTAHTVTASMAASDDLTGIGLEIRVQTAAGGVTQRYQRLLMGVGV